jgi:hypothetical protein
MTDDGEPAVTDEKYPRARIFNSRDTRVEPEIVTDEKEPRSRFFNSRDACVRCGEWQYPLSLIRYSRFGDTPLCHTCYQAARRAALHCDPAPISCAACGQAFTPTRSDARCCSAACRQRLHRQLAHERKGT